MAKCFKCGLSKFRRNQVKGRGEIPAKVLFIGEAPGKSEDLRGKAFIGVSGRILNKGIVMATMVAGFKEPPSFYITNSVQCRPCNFKFGDNRQPTIEEIKTCRENLEEVYLEVKPSIVVFLGKVPEQALSKSFPGAYPLRHPAYLSRRGGVASPEFRTFVRNLSEIFRKVEEESK